MVLLKSKEPLGEEKSLRGRSGTFVIARRKAPSEIPRSVTGGTSSSTLKGPEEWKRPGVVPPVLLKPEPRMLEEKTSSRRLWSKRTASKGLKENLANSGSLESVIQMGKELIEDLSPDSTDPDEIAYREEQALFWYEKAAERGSSEAKDLIKQMAERNSTGINASNRLSLSEVISLPEEELVGKRIGNLLFNSISENADSMTILSGSLHGHSSLKSESLTRSELVACGKEYMRGRLVPEVDAKLISVENQVDLSGRLLNTLALLLYSLQNLMTALFLQHVYLYLVIFTLLFKYRIFVSFIFILKGAALVVFTGLSLILIQRPLEKRRFEAWTLLWENQSSSSKSRLSQKELTLAQDNFSSIQSIRLALLSSFSVGLAETLWGSEHSLTYYLNVTLFVYMFIFESKLNLTLLMAVNVTYGSGISILSPYMSEWVAGPSFLINASSLVIIFIVSWIKGPCILPSLLTIVKSLNGSPNPPSIWLCFVVSAYYCLRRGQKRLLGVLGLLLGGMLLIRVGVQEIPLSNVSLDSYTSLCPSQMDCAGLQGLRVNWTDLRVISLRQRMLRHPLNEVLPYLRLPLSQDYNYFHSLDFKYCDLGLLQEPLITDDSHKDKQMEKDEGIFSFHFGSSSEDVEDVRLHRRTLRARLMSGTLCQTMSEGKLIHLMGYISSMTSDLDLTAYS